MSDAKPMRWAGTGIGVTDLAKSVAFYTEMVGLKVTGEYKLPNMTEIVLSFGSGPILALMHHTDGVPRNYKNNPVKLAFSCDDPQAAFEKMRAAGYKITRPLVPLPGLEGGFYGFAQDPDGYDVELIKWPEGSNR